MDADQYVSINTVAGFNQVKRLTPDLKLVVECLRGENHKIDNNMSVVCNLITLVMRVCNLYYTCDECAFPPVYVSVGTRSMLSHIKCVQFLNFRGFLEMEKKGPIFHFQN